MGGGAMSSWDSRPQPCTSPFSLAGPTAAPSYVNAAPSAQGVVTISGARFGVDRSFNYPLPNILVGLFNATSNLFQRVTLTDSNGHYAFHDVSNPTALQTVLIEDAFLRQTTRSSANFLRSTVDIEFGVPQYGSPQNIPSNGVSNFALLIDNEQTPSYNRPLNATGFEGDCKPIAFWQFQTTGSNRKTNYPASVLAAIKTSASQLVSAGSGCTADISSSDALQQNLAAASLNLAAGKGIFEPYNVLQWWYFNFGRHVFCDITPSSVDYNMAVQFLSAINSATDLDRGTIS